MTEQKRKGGRPRKAADELRTERLSAPTLTAAERAYVERQAELAGLTLAEFQRRAMLGIRITPRASAADDRAIAEVNRIGVNLHQITRALNFGQGIPNDIAIVMDEARAALARLGRDGP